MTRGTRRPGIGNAGRDRPGSMRRLLSWLGGSFLLYIVGEPVQERVIDPVMEPFQASGDAVVDFLLRPLAVLLIPVIVCLGVVVVATREADPEGRPRRLRVVAVGLVVIFLGATLWSDLADRPWLTYLATAALTLIAILGLARASRIAGGRKVGLAASVLSLAALLYGVSMAKKGAGVLGPISAAARIDLGSSFLLGVCFCAFGLAVLLDLHRLLMVAMVATAVPMVALSVIFYAASDLPFVGTGYLLMAVSLAAGAFALRRGGRQAPGVAGVIGRISGKAGTCAAASGGCAGLVLAVGFAGIDQGVLADQRGLLVTSYMVGGLAFWALAAGLITGHRLPMAVAALLLGVSFGCAAAADALVGAYGREDGTTATFYTDWTLVASADALASAAFLIAGGGLLVRHYDRYGRVRRFVSDLVERLQRLW